MEKSTAARLVKRSDIRRAGGAARGTGVPESTAVSSGHHRHDGGGGTYAAAAAPQQPQRRGALQLWQFLVTLLDDPNNASCIVWTGRGMEFKLVEPEEVYVTEGWPPGYCVTFKHRARISYGRRRAEKFSRPEGTV